MQDILAFADEYRFLSNFYPAEFMWNEVLWPSSEHAYQAAKTTDRAVWLKIIKDNMTAGEVKELGGTLPLRADWHDVKQDIMYEIVKAKFLQNPELKAKLLATRDALLEEGNSWDDRFWGISPPGSGHEQNELGKILMKVRQGFHAQSLQKDVI